MISNSHHRPGSLLTCMGVVLIFICSSVTASDSASGFLGELSDKVAAAEKTEQRVLLGKDGWLFFMGELRSMSVGPFWGDHAVKVSRASRAKYADPLPAIVEFNRQCEKAGAELILVPVPAKSLIYPDKISDAVEVGTNGIPPRLDTHHKKFYALLKEKGVKVLDLTDAFMAKRVDKTGNMYCMHDTHWSSKACQLTAKAIANKFKDRPWLKELKDSPKVKLALNERPFEITGDLNQYLKDKPARKEKLPMVFVGQKKAGASELTPLDKDRNSPVILMGDSHTLVFNDGSDLHTRGAGLADHLAFEFGCGIDLIGIRGSGTTVPRIELARRRDNLKGKKLVIWCFASRQFTESVNGWMTRVPVVK